ncbi:hypothetical protein, partial [Pseudomonas rossensis]|uniref:hypothetical protein n=1 Tax=Pseudomonas rossensis TaxID=2305471 RepID=UPI003260A64A
MLGPINLMRHIQSGSTIQSTGSSPPAPDFVQVCATSSGVSRLAPDSIHANPLLAGLDGQRLRLLREAAHIRELVPDINPLAYAQRHMALEGKLLNLLPESHYLEIHHLKLALGCPLHPMLSGQQESDALIADLEAYIA